MVDVHTDILFVVSRNKFANALKLNVCYMKTANSCSTRCVFRRFGGILRRVLHETVHFM